MNNLTLTIVMIVVLLAGASCSGGAGLPGPGPAPGDTTAPDIQLTGATDGSSYGNLVAGDNTLLLKGVASDLSGITNMSMRINNTLVASSNSSQLNFLWDVTTYDDGEYVVEVQASDGTNIATRSVQVTVDNILNINPGWFFPIFPVLEVIPFPGP